MFEEAEASHQLHFLDVPDEVCRSRMHARRAAGGDGVSDAEFDHVTSFFVAPEPSEGFNVIRYGDAGLHAPSSGLVPEAIERGRWAQSLATTASLLICPFS